MTFVFLLSTEPYLGSGICCVWLLLTGDWLLMVADGGAFFKNLLPPPPPPPPPPPIELWGLRPWEKKRRRGQAASQKVEACCQTCLTNDPLFLCSEWNSIKHNIVTGCLPPHWSTVTKNIHSSTVLKNTFEVPLLYEVLAFGWSDTSQRDILYFLLHFIGLTNRVSPDVLTLNVCDKLKSGSLLRKFKDGQCIVTKLKTGCFYEHSLVSLHHVGWQHAHK